MGTGSILGITTKITSQIFCKAVVSALRGVLRDGVMPQDKRLLLCKRLSKEKLIKIDLADNRNVLISL